MSRDWCSDLSCVFDVDKICNNCKECGDISRCALNSQVECTNCQEC